LGDCWDRIFYQSLDEFPISANDFFKTLKVLYNKLEWYRVYDLIEFLAEDFTEDFMRELDLILEAEKSAYRFVNKKIVPVIDIIEIEVIEKASNSGYDLSQGHIRKSINMLSNKNEPDYKNSIKESISAVEALVKKITNGTKKSLGDLTAKLQKDHGIHPALVDGISKIYGYTCDAPGIRHSNKEGSEFSPVDEAEAIFMLVFCSSLVNFLNTKLSN
jgi:hypothetical protein